MMQKRTIHDFHLEVSAPSPGRLKVRLLDAPGIERVVIPRDDIEFPLMRSYKDLTALGRALYESVFYDKQIRDKFETCRASYCAGNVGGPVGLRLVLHILSNPEREEPLLSLPWELLHDGQDWLAHDPTLSIVRLLNVKQREDQEEKIRPPLRVLLTYAEPRDKKFDGEQIFETIRGVIASTAQKLHLQVLPHATKNQLKTLIQEGFHIIHFLGHGDVEAQRAQLGLLLLEHGESPSGDILTATELVSWIKEATIWPRLFVLTACHSGNPTGFGFLGVATALLDAGVEAVVAMQTELYSDEAKAFAEAFYQTLALHRTVDDAMQAGRQALLYWRDRSLEADIGRLLILSKGQGDVPTTRWHLGAPRTFHRPQNISSIIPFPGWAVPVLFLRGDGWLGQGSPEPCIIWPIDNKEMVYIPEGDFYIDKYPVTCSEYRRFASEFGLIWKAPSWEDEENGSLPATNMTWQAAQKFAQGVGKRLPSVEEWQQAALSGLVDKTLPFPWGENFQPGYCNTKESGRLKPIPVQAEDHRNCNPSGMCGIVGNVAEWAIDENGQGVLCGGSYKDSPDDCIIQRVRQGQANWGIGFRCIVHWSDINQLERSIRPCHERETGGSQ